MESTDIKVGWIGTGIMGSPMCGHLMEKLGYKTFVYNRTKSKTDTLVRKILTSLYLSYLILIRSMIKELSMQSQLKLLNSVTSSLSCSDTQLMLKR